MVLVLEVHMLRDFFEFILPHFATDDVGCYLSDDDELVTAFAMDCWEPDEDPAPAAVVKVRSLSWLGIGWFGVIAGAPVAFDEWQDEQQ